MALPSSSTAVHHLIVGAGAAGLSLAYALTRHPATAQQSILLLDPDDKRLDDRTWSYWERTDRPGLFAELPGLASHEWRTAEVRTYAERQVLPLAPFAYRTIRGLAFYEAMRAHLATCPHVRWERAAVETIADGPDGATARTTDGRTHRATWLYDSRFAYSALPRAIRYQYLAQHFVGWEIETAHDCFDPTIATLFDFRTPQAGAMRFHYLLPYSPRRALVEYTLFSKDLLPAHAYEAELRRFVREELRLPENEYRLVATEQGVIPMTDQPLPARPPGSHRVVRIGSGGGASKPSTGFTFRRIQLRTARIVESLARTGAPWAVPSAPRRFRLFDAMLLDVLSHHPNRAAAIFAQLFRRNPTARLLDFLNEDTSFLADLAVMNSVPWRPFVAALWRQARRGFPALRGPA